MPEPDELEGNWLATPTDIRMWAIENAHKANNAAFKDMPLMVEDIMCGALLFAWEVMRQPDPIVVPPNIEDRDIEYSGGDVIRDAYARYRWKTDRGLA